MNSDANLVRVVVGLDTKMCAALRAMIKAGCSQLLRRTNVREVDWKKTTCCLLFGRQILKVLRTYFDTERDQTVTHSLDPGN